LPGNYQSTILAATGDVTNHAGLTLDALATAVAQYSLVYPNPNDIDLQYSINFSPNGLTVNEHSVGNAVNAIQTARSSPNFAPIAAALFYQPTVAALGQAYDSLSGEGVSGVEQTALAADQLFMDSISQQTQIWLGDQPSNPVAVVMYADDDLLGYAGSDPRNPILKALAGARQHPWRFWEEPYGGGGSISGELPLGSSKLGYSGGGLAIGTDYQVDPDTILGLALGGNLSSFDVSGRETSGNVEGGQLSAYGAKRWGALYATGIVGFGLFSNSEQRFAVLPGSTAPIIPVPGFAEQLNGSFDSQSFNARFEAGWRASFEDFNVTPFGAVEYGLLHLDHFSESEAGGPDLLGLSYASHSVDSVPTFLGVQFDSLGLNSPNPLSYWVRLSWMHEFEPYRTVDPSFLAAPGFDFIVNGAVAPRDAAAVDLGLKYALTPHLNALTSFDGLFAPAGSSYAGTVGLQSTW
jgi:outer membrane autotransporter protein